MIRLSVEEARRLDTQATKEFLIPSLVLMENAGRSVAKIILDLLYKQPNTTQLPILCGGGNNGGDGFVVARHLHQHQIKCRVYLLKPKESYSGDAAINLNILDKLQVPIEPYEQFEKDATSIFQSTPLVIVDAMLGTGFKEPLRDDMAQIIKKLNTLKKSHSAKVTIVSIDTPSGLHGNTGPKEGFCLKSDYTATFVAQKKAFELPESRAYLGKVDVIDIGIPHVLLEALKSKKA